MLLVLELSVLPCGKRHTFCQAHIPTIALPSCTAQTVPPRPLRLGTTARQLFALLDVLNDWT